MQARGIFSDAANDVRLQNNRRFIMKQKLEEHMGQWMWEAIEEWKDGAKTEAAKAQKKDEPTDCDIIFKHLTKPATNIDPTRAVSQVPLFKPLYASYSQPSNWR